MCPLAPAEGAPKSVVVTFCDTKYTQILCALLRQGWACIGIMRDLDVITSVVRSSNKTVGGWGFAPHPIGGGELTTPPTF